MQPYLRGHWVESRRGKPSQEEMELGTEADLGSSAAAVGALDSAMGVKPTSHRFLVITGGDHEGQQRAWLGVRTA